MKQLLPQGRTRGDRLRAELQVADPLNNYVQTYTLVDVATEENGCLRVLPRRCSPLSSPPEDQQKLYRGGPNCGPTLGL